MADVKKRNEDLVQSLREFNAAFEAERASRMEREQRIVDRIARQEHESIRRFDEERQTREQIYITAKKKLEDAVLARTKTDEKFQAAMWEELAAVKKRNQSRGKGPNYRR
jgi:DNA helicase IV